MQTKTCLASLVTLASFLLAPAARAQNPTLLTTLTNPTPWVSDRFGQSVAGVGSDRVLIGSYQDHNATELGPTGAAYLFGANGTLLVTFTNPVPEVQEQFGRSVAAVGNDRVLIGAPLHGNIAGASDYGEAYLFSTNGAWMTTFTNPTPGVSDYFGWSVAAVGSDRVLIGAPYDWDISDFDPMGAGAAYLFSTNGTLLQTFTKPIPANNENFGWSVAAVGTDHVLIGAPFDKTGAASAGAVYLFSTGGTLLNTFTNPTPAANDNFGFSVAAVGSDLVVIGARYDDTVASDAGAAYLYSTGGTLLNTFTNPTLARGAGFGWSVAAVGSDRVLIGAYADSTGAPAAGAAYLFSTNGTLLTTLTNPAPAAADLFGVSVAAVGSDRVLIGAYMDDAGADDAGAAYLFALSSRVGPTLTVVPAIPGSASISWTPATPDFVLQVSPTLTPPAWTNAPSGATNPITVPATLPTKFYRLFKP